MDSSRKDHRKDIVLEHIVEAHVATASPVSSKMVAARMGGNVSSATIRNVMSELEHHGLIEQPHTSAGRIPTNEGYRRYVSMRTNKVRQRKKEAERLAREYTLRVETIKEIIEKTTFLISRELHNAGVMIWPGMDNVYLRHLELVKVRSEVILAVLVTMTNAVKNYLIKLDSGIAVSELEKVARYVNENYAASPIARISDSMRETLDGDAVSDETGKILRTAIKVFDDVSKESLSNDIYWEGIDNFMDEPEFSDISFIRGLFQVFSEKKRELADILTRDLSSGDIKVYVGEECGLEMMRGCSMVTCGYFFRGKTVGRMGVVGPTRMDYDRALRTVSCLSDLISAKLDEFDVER